MKKNTYLAVIIAVATANSVTAVACAFQGDTFAALVFFAASVFWTGEAINEIRK